MTAVRRPTVVVVGAGISGLAAAWELASAGAPAGAERPHVVVVDAAERIGGKLRAREFAGRTVDMAADAFLGRRPEAVELVDELGATDDLVPIGATGASVYARGRLRALPSGLNLGLPTSWWPLARSGILTWAESLRAARDVAVWHPTPPAHLGDRAVGDIVGARMGRAVVERLADPLIGGIHAGSADDLDAAATFPLLIGAAQQPGSLMHNLRPKPGASPAPGDGGRPMFWSLTDGVASLATTAAAALAGAGVEVRTGVQVDAVSREGDRWVLATGPRERRGRTRPGRLEAHGVVLAVDARRAGVLLAPVAPVAAGLLSTIEYASVAVVTLSLPPDTFAEPLVGTGFLMPRTTVLDGRPALMTGCTYLSNKWPHLSRPGDLLVRVSAGRYGDERAGDLDDEELIATVCGELGNVLGMSTSPLDATVERWTPALPQYRPGHLLRVAQIEEALHKVPSMAVAGAALRGVGIPACIGSGRQAARSVLADLGGRPATGSAGSSGSSGSSGSAGTAAGNGATA